MTSRSRRLGSKLLCGAALATATASLPAAGEPPGPASPSAWAPYAGGPVAASAPDPRDEPLLVACGEGDEALHRAAAELAMRRAQGMASIDMLQLGELMRKVGDPHVGARCWTLARRGGVERVHATRRLAAWLRGSNSFSLRRCGVASASTSARGEVLAVVMAPVQADLRARVPSRARTGAWLTIDAVMRTRASGAKVVVLGPRGAPRTIPTSFDAGTGNVVARFMVDQPGRWLAQLVASTERGPLPVLETVTYAGGVAAAPVIEEQAPGERAARAGLDAGAALHAMLDEARAMERLGPLMRDPELDGIALAHARAMQKAGRVGHDVGDGSPPERVAEAGMVVTEVGENVSRAASVVLAHRSLWASPSHRANMLHPRYGRVGIAVVQGNDSTLWVTQLFGR